MNLQAGFRVLDWQVLPQENRLTGDSSEIHITPRAMDVLVFLASRAGEVVSREDFGQALWTDAIVTDDSLTGCISELRRTLGDQTASPRYIETIPKRGYRLIAPVTPLDPAGSAQFETGAEAGPEGGVVEGLKASPRRLAALGIVVLVSALIAIWTYWPDGDSPPAPVAADGIAVLPFANLSPNPDHAFFASGIHEEVLTHLSHVGDLRVISRTSMEAIAAEGLAVPDIARRLGVSHVLEGSVRRDNNRVRVTVQLIEAATDAHLWADNYDRDMTDIFAIQSEIALAIVDELELSLDPRAAARLAERPTDNMEAYEHYVAGRERLRRPADRIRSPSESLEINAQAEALFRAAIDKDANFAAAHAALSYTLLSFLSHFSAEQAEARYQEAVEASRRAIRLEPGLADGHLTLGKAYFFHGSGDAAWEQFKLAAEINPNDPEILRHLSFVHANRGESIDRLRVLRRAAAIDPEAPIYRQTMAHIYRRLGLMAEARDAYRHAWEQIAPNPDMLNYVLGLTAMDEGNRAALRKHIDGLPTGTDNPLHAGFALRLNLGLGDMETAETLFDAHQDFFVEHAPLMSALILIHRGKAERVEQVLLAFEQRLKNRIPRAWGSSLAVSLARIEALRGQREEALAHFQAAFDKGYRGALLWNFGHPDNHPPSLQEIAGDPRYLALQDRIDADLARMRAELTGN